MIEWDRGEPVWAEDSAKWKQLAQELRERIESGRYRSRKRIPSQRQLEQEFGVSRDVIRQAVGHLVAMGMLKIDPGVGTSVLPPENWRLPEE
ncbi:GntR family transcriptional regulator [Sphaerisporangium album]|uniref:GntR family transcriptional regulator n=1 Tax=Sphaerisporangium album TaxID=509200 RepID=A0A367FNP5_9ACTN|nr:winged helix-turn-helix domain-containing protein [Sphaerisporangium album]RCG32023.1 GntR family transcriptional regulator [Sphaerisporangium album]